MTIMGKYCKVYPLEQLRQFDRWTEYIKNTRTEKNEIETNRKLTENNFLYLQENYLVTDGIFKDNNIVFDNTTPEWKDFCTKVLEFKIPI